MKFTCFSCHGAMDKRSISFNRVLSTYFSLRIKIDLFQARKGAITLAAGAEAAMNAADDGLDLAGDLLPPMVR